MVLFSQPATSIVKAKSMIHFEKIDFKTVDWKQLNQFPDRTICQSKAWLGFIAESQNAEPIVAKIIEDQGTVGYFTGLKFRKWGVQMLGSPFPGWTSNYMGFNLAPGISRRAVLKELAHFVFDGLNCIHFEIMDRHLALEDANDLGYQNRLLESFELDLTQSEDILWTGVKQNFRRKINKGRKLGVIIEEATPDECAQEFYSQLDDVFSKQSLKPTYGIGRVQLLIKHLHASGNLLLMRALSPGGDCIATVVFPGDNNMAYFWGGASWRASQPLCPNELLTWQGILHWKARGAKAFDFGGGGEYKRKYGGKRICIPWFRKSKFPLMESLRSIASKLVSFRQRR